MKTVIRTLVVLICLSALILCFVGCNNTPLHVFKFNTPDNFDTLSVEEQLDWARKNGYLVINYVDGKPVVENKEKLNSFLENKSGEKELLIIKCDKYEDGLKCTFAGIYFDGKQYHAVGKLGASNKEWTSIYKYDICDIEEYEGRKYLYVSNGSTLTYKDELNTMFSSSLEVHTEFAKKYFSIMRIE